MAVKVNSHILRVSGLIKFCFSKKKYNKKLCTNFFACFLSILWVQNK